MGGRMAVLRLVRKSNKETIETLEWMLQEARRGKLNDLLIAFRHEDLRQDVAFTGLFKEDSSKALMAIMKMSVMLTMVHDHVYGPP